MSFMIYFFYSRNLFLLILFLNLNFILYNFNFSLMMAFMLVLLMKLIYFSMKDKQTYYFSTFKYLILNMMFFLMFMYFLCSNFLLFYIFFEMISLSISLLLIYSSFSMERLKALMYMFIFMSLGTFPMLIMLFYLSSKFSVFLFCLTFFMKIPILFFHLWLPKAHVEANYYDSMILAALLLKLGGYGLFNLNLSFKMNFFFCWCFISVYILSFFIIFLFDMKMILAYSSIIHMTFLVIMFFSNSIMMEKSMLLNMIGHSFSSSLMFYMMGMIYEVSMSRSFLLNKGLYMNYKLFFLFFFFLMFVNMGFPPFITFFMEIYFYFFLLNFSPFFLLALVLMFFISMIFNLILIKNTLMGVFSNFFKMYNLKISSLVLFLEMFFYMIYFM